MHNVNLWFIIWYMRIQIEKPNLCNELIGKGSSVLLLFRTEKTDTDVIQSADLY